MQPLPTALSLLRRSTRYVATFGWLLRQQFKAAPWLYLATIGSGLAHRLGNIVVLFATVKCALWLIKPEVLPRPIATLFGSFVGTPEFVVLLLIIPPILVVGSAVGGIIFAKARMQVVDRCGEAVAIAEARKRIADAATRERTPETAQEIAVPLLGDWMALYRLQTNLINLIVVALTFAIAVMMGMLLDPVVTGIVAVIALVVAGIFVGRQHERSYRLSEKQAKLRIQGVGRTPELTKNISEALESSADAASLDSAIARHYAGSMAEFQFKNRDDAFSRLGLDVAQGVMLFALLAVVYVRGLSMNATEIAYAVILLIVLRFTMAQIRVIASVARALSKDYRRLVVMAGYAADTGSKGIGSIEMLDFERDQF